MFIRRLWNWFYGIRCSIFSILEVIFNWPKVPLLRYGLKRLFSGFSTGLMAFTVLILALWRLFLVDWKYSRQDISQNVHFPALKLVLRHYLCYFQHFRVYILSIRGTVAKLRAKAFISLLWNGFTAFTLLFIEFWRFYLFDQRYHC